MMETQREEKEKKKKKVCIIYVPININFITGAKFQSLRSINTKDSFFFRVFFFQSKPRLYNKNNNYNGITITVFSV